MTARKTGASATKRVRPAKSKKAADHELDDLLQRTAQSAVESLKVIDVEEHLSELHKAAETTGPDNSPQEGGLKIEGAPQHLIRGLPWTVIQRCADTDSSHGYKSR